MDPTPLLQRMINNMISTSLLCCWACYSWQSLYQRFKKTIGKINKNTATECDVKKSLKCTAYNYPAHTLPAMGWTVCPPTPPNSYVKALTPSGMLSGGGTFEGWLDFMRRSPSWDWCPLKKMPRASSISPLSEDTVRSHCLLPRSGLSPEPCHTGTPISDSQLPEPWGDSFLLVKLPCSL